MVESQSSPWRNFVTDFSPKPTTSQSNSTGSPCSPPLSRESTRSTSFSIAPTCPRDDSIRLVCPTAGDLASCGDCISMDDLLLQPVDNTSDHQQQLQLQLQQQEVRSYFDSAIPEDSTTTTATPLQSWTNPDPTQSTELSDDYEPRLRRSTSSISLSRRAPSIRSALATAHSNAGSPPPSSVFSSPQLAALTDLTPLPSPIALGYSSWRTGKSLSRASSTASTSGSTFNIGRRRESSDRSRSSSRRKPYYGLAPNNNNNSNNNDLLSATQEEGDTNGQAKHSRNRSLSDYAPTVLPHIPKSRKATMSGPAPPRLITPSQSLLLQSGLHREEYLAVQRGLAALSGTRPPTPPRSVRSGYDSGDTTDSTSAGPVQSTSVPSHQTYTVRSVRTQQLRTYRKLRQLGQGTFSQVVLAAREFSNGATTTSECASQRLVAVKIVNYGPAGGADEERVEVSLKREVDILKSIDHPSVVQLKAFGSDSKSALLVLDFCPGGDLFEFASRGLSILGPAVIRRMFAELVAAVRYLHQNFIVHRDIKLESKLSSAFYFFIGATWSFFWF